MSRFRADSRLAPSQWETSLQCNKHRLPSPGHKPIISPMNLTKADDCKPITMNHPHKFWTKRASITEHPWNFSLIEVCRSRADSRFVPSQWETALLCNDVSHWLGANLESALPEWNTLPASAVELLGFYVDPQLHDTHCQFEKISGSSSWNKIF